MTDPKANWHKILTKLIRKINSLVSSEEADILEKTLTQMQQQIASLHQQLDIVTAEIPNQIEEAVQKRLNQLPQSAPLLSTPQLQLNKTTFAPGEEILVSFVALPTFASNAWVGVIPSDIAHGNETINDQYDLSYQYFQGRTSGTLVFKAPAQNGFYDLRMHDTDSNGKEVYSVSFEVLLK